MIEVVKPDEAALREVAELAAAAGAVLVQRPVLDPASGKSRAVIAVCNQAAIPPGWVRVVRVCEPQ